ncbi:MAG: family 78 glycoside hydrolase catalytic domain, partial [Opitutaceae bacterium]
IVWWRVIVWTGVDQSARSEPTTWEMGLLQKSDWQAQWIGGGDVAPNHDPLVQAWCEQVVYLPTRDSGYERERLLDKKALEQRPDRIATVKAAQPAVWLRKRFVISGPFVRARLYSAALGYSELYLDGKKISDRVLDPGQTDYETRALYNTDDLTAGLQPGPHEVRILLAEGWYGQSQGFFTPAFRYGNPLAIAQLELTRADGSRETITTDSTWEYAASAIAKSSLYSGEVVDGRVGETNLRWQPAAGSEKSQPLPVALEAQLLPPTRKVRTLPAKSVIETRPGVWLFDLGQNIAGWVRLRVDAPRGTAVDLKFAELVTPRNELDWDTQGRRAVGVYQHDRYIAAGTGDEYFEPKFTYHGFQYIEVTGLGKPPTAADLTGYLVRSDVPTIGHFSCSDPLMNRLHETIKWTYEGNLISLPSDCPTREKCGWLGDAHVTQEMTYYNYDMAQFWSKYSHDIRTSTALHGGLPDSIAPGRRPGIPAFDWGVGMVFIPWLQYQYTGDRRLLEAQWPDLVRFLEHSRGIARGWIIHDALGDWCDQPATIAMSMTRVDGSPFNSLPATTATMHFFHAAKIMTDIARVLGHDQAATQYEAWSESIRTAINDDYFHVRGNTYGSQTGNALALMYGIPAPEKVPAIARALAQEVEFGSNGHFNTGSHGSTYLYSALSDFGHPGVARGIFAQKTYPSYGYMFSLGATTLWENMGRFDPVTKTTQKSLNHPFHGGFDHWFYEAVAGVRLDKTAPAFKKLLFVPELVGLLTHAEGSVETAYGRAASAWKIEAGRFNWNIQIPPNTSATVFFPDSVNSLHEGGSALKTAANTFNGRPVTQSLQLGSGSYHFEGTLNAKP